MLRTELSAWLPREARTAVCSGFLWLLYYTEFVACVNFVYRYLRVVRSTTITDSIESKRYKITN
jgi:hypothetical protein